LNSQTNHSRVYDSIISNLSFVQTPWIRTVDHFLFITSNYRCSVTILHSFHLSLTLSS
jgi:hypothetical protein